MQHLLLLLRNQWQDLCNRLYCSTGLHIAFASCWRGGGGTICNSKGLHTHTPQLSMVLFCCPRSQTLMRDALAHTLPNIVSGTVACKIITFCVCGRTNNRFIRSKQ